MDLFLTPCRNCLQCLPFFQLSSPPLLPNHAAALEGETSNPVKGDEDKALSLCPTNTTVQQQDLPVSQVKTKLCAAAEPQEGPMEAALAMTGENQADKCETTSVPEEQDPAACTITEIIIAPPVTTSIIPETPEISKTTIPSELPLQVPFINDVTFSAGGLMPLPAPMTPAPMGSGYAEVPYHTHQEHGALNGHHHDPSPPSHTPIPHPPLESPNEHHKDPSHHHHQHVSKDDQSHESEHGHHGDHHLDHHSGDGDKVPSHQEAEHNHQHEPEYGHHQVLETSHHDPGVHEIEHLDGALPAIDISLSAPVSSIENEHCSEHEAGYTTGTGLLETYHSEPIVHPEGEGEEDELLETYHSEPIVHPEGEGEEEDDYQHVANEEDELLETYHSEPIVHPEGEGEEEDDYQHVANDVVHGESHNLVQPGRRRRHRDHMKDQFMGIREQIKQGGHHLKEEGSKHVQSIVNNINKHAQHIEESASFFNVPRI